MLLTPIITFILNVLRGILLFDDEIPKTDPEENFTAKEFILAYGYRFEEHVIQAPDGGISVLHRIPGENSSPSNQRRTPVLLFHPISTSSLIWVMNTKERSLAFYLVNNGYDVWMVNARGTTVSSHYNSQIINNPKFWDFSFQEVGLIDTPIMIDYILNKTGYQKLFFLGMSMGCTVAFALLSTKPEYNDKIHALIALSPVVYMKHSTSPFRYAAFLLPLLQRLYGNRISMPDLISGILIPILYNICIKIRMQGFCFNTFLQLTGDNIAEYNKSRIPVYTKYYPDITSLKTYNHFSQLTLSGKFQMYDYEDPEINYRNYNDTSPPVFDISKITAPVALFHGIDDSLSTDKDMQRLASELPNLILYTPLMNTKGSGHFK